MFVTLPILMALSWVPSNNVAEKPAAPAAPQQSADAIQAALDTITCPLTGDEIPSCCCPAKN